jgi:hypothetical protein
VDASKAIQLLEIGVATGVAALTISRARPLRPLRWLIQKYSNWWGELISCPYCMSHWIGALLIAWGRGSPRYWHWAGLYQASLEWLVVVAIAAPAAALVYQSIITILPPRSETYHASPQEEIETEQRFVA